MASVAGMVAMTVLAVGIMILPATPLRSRLALEGIEASGCARGLIDVVARPGAESPAFGLTIAGGTGRLFPLMLPVDRMRDGFPQAWFRPSYVDVPDGMVILAYQRKPDQFGEIVPLVWPRTESVPGRQLMHFCAEPPNPAWSPEFHVVTSARVLGH